MSKILGQISEALKKGKMNDVKALVQQALDSKVDVASILNDALIAGMGIVGVKFKNNEVYVPEVLIAARAMQEGIKLLEPLLAGAGIEPLGKIALGTVKGDLHDIGKNLVCMMLRGAGFEVLDLGIDVTPEKFIEAVEKENCQIVAMSALLTTTMPQMKAVVDAAKAAAAKPKTMVGGAPVTQAYADEIGADGYADDAATAADVAKTLIA